MSVNQARRETLRSLIRRLGLEAIDSTALLSELERAMTHVSSGRADHNERLEFLGDAVLRLAATLYLDQHHPDQGDACESGYDVLRHGASLGFCISMQVTEKL